MAFSFIIAFYMKLQNVLLKIFIQTGRETTGQKVFSKRKADLRYIKHHRPAL